MEVEDGQMEVEDGEASVPAIAHTVSEDGELRGEFPCFGQSSY